MPAVVGVCWREGSSATEQLCDLDGVKSGDRSTPDLHETAGVVQPPEVDGGEP